MNINPYLFFQGECRQAIDFYTRVLNAKVEDVRTFRGSPMEAHAGPDMLDKIMHAMLRIGDAVVMLSDSPAQYYQKPGGYMMTLNSSSAEEAERLFAALSENAKEIRMPLQQTFWSVRYGQLIDQFGIPWMVNCQQPANAAGASQ
jgi:PhnB protein